MQENASIESVLSTIKGYDYNWISLLSSKPILFEDPDYLKVSGYINNIVTNDEINAYKRGDLREIYTNFENLLMCNIDQYERIISFCTIYFLSYYRIDEEIYSDNIPEHPIEFDITPTKLFCMCLISKQSTDWEIEYGWNITLKGGLDVAFPILNQNKIFSTFISYRSLITNSSGFRETFLLDKIDDNNLYRVCRKFTKNSNVLNEQELYDFNKYITHVDKQLKTTYKTFTKCLDSLYTDKKDAYAVYVFNEDIYINTINFSLKIFKQDGRIFKDYINNSYEALVAEKYFVPSIRQQIEWCKYKISNDFKAITDNLTNLLKRLLERSFRNIICVKYMDNNITAKLKFSGVYDNIYIKQSLYHGKTLVKEDTKCLSKERAAEYIINQGYYIFGFENDVNKLLEQFEEHIITDDGYISKICGLLINQYISYSLNIRDFLKPIVKRYKEYNDAIKNAYVNGINDNDLEILPIRIMNLKGKKLGSSENVIKTINQSLRNKENEDKQYFNVIK